MFLQIAQFEEVGSSPVPPIRRSPEVSSGNEVGSLNPTLPPLYTGLPGEPMGFQRIMMMVLVMAMMSTVIISRATSNDDVADDIQSFKATVITTTVSV